LIAKFGFFELNEFQVQMAIDKFYTYKLREDLGENLNLSEKTDNETV
jgi:hypothetical protein